MSTSEAPFDGLAGHYQTGHPYPMETTRNQMGQGPIYHGTGVSSPPTVYYPQTSNDKQSSRYSTPVPPTLYDSSVFSPGFVQSLGFLHQHLPIPAQLSHGKWMITNMEWLQQRQHYLPQVPNVDHQRISGDYPPLPTSPQFLSPFQAPCQVDAASLESVMHTLSFKPTIPHTLLPTWAQDGYDDAEIEMGKVVTLGQGQIQMPFAEPDDKLLQLVYYFGHLKIIPLSQSNYDVYFQPFFPSSHSLWTFWSTVALLYSISNYVQQYPNAAINWDLISQNPFLTGLERTALHCEQHYMLLMSISSMHYDAAAPFLNPIDISLLTPSQRSTLPMNKLMLVSPEVMSSLTSSSSAPHKSHLRNIVELYSLHLPSTPVTTVLAYDFVQGKSTGYNLVGITEHTIDTIRTPHTVPLSPTYLHDLQQASKSQLPYSQGMPIRNYTSTGVPVTSASAAEEYHGMGVLPPNHQDLPSNDGAQSTAGTRRRPAAPHKRLSRYQREVVSEVDTSSSSDDDDDDDDDDEYDDGDDSYGRTTRRPGRTGRAAPRQQKGSQRRTSSRRVTDASVPGAKPPASATRTSARRQEQIYVQQQLQQQQEYSMMAMDAVAAAPLRRSNRAPQVSQDGFDDYTPPPRKTPVKKPSRFVEDYDDDASSSSDDDDEEISYSDDDDGAGNYYHANQRKLKKLSSSARRNRTKTAVGVTSSRVSNSNHLQKGNQMHDGDDGDNYDDMADGDDDDDDDDGGANNVDEATAALESYIATLSPPQLKLYYQQLAFEEERKKVKQPRIEKILAVREVKKQLKMRINGETVPPNDIYYDPVTSSVVIPDLAPMLYQQQVEEYQRYQHQCISKSSGGDDNNDTTKKEVCKGEQQSAQSNGANGDQTTALLTRPPLQPPPGLTFTAYFQWMSDQDDYDAYDVYYRELIECVNDFFIESVDDYTISGYHYDISIQFEQEPDSEAEPHDYEAIAHMSPFQYQAYIDLREQKRVERQKIKQERRRQQQQQQQDGGQTSASSNGSTTTSLHQMTDGNDDDDGQMVKIEMIDAKPVHASTIPDTYIRVQPLPSKIVRLEYLVKPLDVSYRHIQWLSPSGLMQVYGKRHAQDRVKRFLAKREETENYNLDKYGGEHFDSKFINIDRILSHRVVLVTHTQLAEMKKTITDVKGTIVPPFHSVAVTNTGAMQVFPTPPPVLDMHLIPHDVLTHRKITPINPDCEPRQLLFSQDLLNRLTDEQHALFDQLEQQYETHFFAHNISEYSVNPKYSKQSYEGSDAEGAWDDDDDVGYTSHTKGKVKSTSGATSTAQKLLPSIGGGNASSDASVAESEHGDVSVLVDTNAPFIPPCEEKIAILEYLIKWNGLGYTQATWEPQYQLSHDINEIKRFYHHNRELSREDTAPKTYTEQEQLTRQQRASKWYEESPKYKNDMELRQYQVEGVNWLIELFIKKQNGILADEMGLGKTVQCVAFLEHLYTQENLHGPFLVVTPLSTLNNWKRESDLWTTQNVVIYHDATGGSAGRDTLRKYEFYSSFHPQIYNKDEITQQVHQANTYVDADGNPSPQPLPPGVVTSYDGTSFQVHHPRSVQGVGMQQAQSEVDAIETLLPIKFNILITSYEMMMSDIAHLRTIPFQYVIIDEGHKLKNQNAKLADAFKELQVQRKLLLTGTPIQNNTIELFALLHFIHPDVFSNKERFVERFGQLSDAGQVAELQKTISPYLLRRMKETVEKSIPNKEETIIDVELTTLQKMYYRAIYERNLKFLKQGGTGQNAPKLINIEAELRKCCNHPWLVRGVEEKEVPPGASEEEYYNATIQASGKLVLLDKLLPKLYEDGHRVLIFSQMVTLLDIISEYLKYRKYKFERLDGNVTGDQRDAAIDRFCRPDSDRFIFLLSTRAGGVGLNLTSADTVIIYDSDWNPQQDVQAQARAHRIGQKNNVLVYRLITRNTYESEMFNRASKKLGLDYAVLKRLEKGSRKQQEATASEIDTILRLGAYGMLDEDDEQRQAFFNSNIEDILKNNSHVISSGNSKEKDNTSSSSNSNTTGVVDFQKQYFSSESSDKAKLDINDTNFWSHILGNDDEYKCQPDVLQNRLNDLVTLKADPQNATDFFNDISKLMFNTFERIKATKENDSTSTRGGGVMLDGEDEDGTLHISTPAAATVPTDHKALTLEEIDELIALLIQFTSTTEIFSDDQLTKGQVWLGELEMRTSRRKNHINYRSANLYNDNENSVQHNRSSRGKLFNKRLRQQYGNNDDDEDIYNYNSEDEETIDPLKRRVPPVNFHETDRGIEYTDRAGINNNIQLIIPKRGRGARPIYNVAVCSVCYCPGELLSCDGPCQRLMHVECMPKGIPKYGTTSRKDNLFHRVIPPPNQLLATVDDVNKVIHDYNIELIRNTRDYAKKYQHHPDAPGIIQGDQVLVEGLIQPIEDNSDDFIPPNGPVVMPSLLDSKKPWICIECQEQTWRCFGCDHPVTTRPSSILGRLMKIAVANMDKQASAEEGKIAGGNRRKRQAAANSRDHDVRFCSVANCGRVAHLGCARQNHYNHFYGKTEILSAYRCSIHFCAVCARNEEREMNKTEEEKEQDREKKRLKQQQMQEKNVYAAANEDEENEDGDPEGSNDSKRGGKVSENSMILCICCSVGYHTRCMPMNATRLARKTMLCVDCTKYAFTNSLGRRVIAFSQNPFTMKILREKIKIKYNPATDNCHINQFVPNTVTSSTIVATTDATKKVVANGSSSSGGSVSTAGTAIVTTPATATGDGGNIAVQNAAANPLNVYPTFALLVDIDSTSIPDLTGKAAFSEHQSQQQQQQSETAQ